MIKSECNQAPTYSKKETALSIGQIQLTSKNKLTRRIFQQPSEDSLLEIQELRMLRMVQMGKRMAT